MEISGRFEVLREEAIHYIYKEALLLSPNSTFFPCCERFTTEGHERWTVIRHTKYIENTEEYFNAVDEQ